MIGSHPKSHPGMSRIRNEIAGTSFLQVLDLWRTSHFLSKGPSERFWEGRAADLVSAMDACESLRPHKRMFSTNRSVGKSLGSAIRKRVGWVEEYRRDAVLGMMYRISRPEPAIQTGPGRTIKSAPDTTTPAIPAATAA